MALADHIQLRSDTSTNWTAANPVLLENEFGFETNTGKFKRGNGTNNWADLDYYLSVYPSVLAPFAVSTAPAAASWTGGMIYVTDEAGGAIPAFSDGTNWRRVSDRTIIS
jgi:hypothetical protein